MRRGNLGRVGLCALALLALLVLLAALFLGWLVWRFGGARGPGAVESPGSEAAVASSGCARCHQGEGPNGVHGRFSLGCEICHLGDASSRHALGAHRGLELEPGALDVVGRTCGPCHPEEVAAVRRSPMATGRGIVRVNRLAFGETPGPDEWGQTLSGLSLVAAPSPAQDHMRRLCAGCHLGVRRHNRDDALAGTATGCAACHMDLAPANGGLNDAGAAPSVAGRAGDARLTRPVAKPVPRPGERSGWRHAPVDSRVSDGRCLGCHSRSGRISLSYQGLSEVAEPPPVAPQPAGGGGGRVPGENLWGENGGACAAPVTLFDGRKGCQLTPDVHQRAGMACVDCHVHRELMGDGRDHLRGQDALEVRCESCHGFATEAPVTDRPLWGAWRDPTMDPLTMRILALRGERRPANEPVLVSERGTPLWNVRPDGAGGWTLSGKVSGQKHAVPSTPPDADHRQLGHERLSCSACHAAWAPRCPSCHTRFEAGGHQWDFGVAAVAPGVWRESHQAMGASTPLLGIAPSGRIEPVVHGMFATLVDAAGQVHEVRRFVPMEPHTTAASARTCGSCHASEASPGRVAGEPPGVRAAGREGRAGYVTEAPAPDIPGAALALAPSRLQRIFFVGRCLTCHERGARIYEDFAAAVDRRAAGEARDCLPLP